MTANLPERIKLTDEQVGTLSRLSYAVAAEDPYALDELVGTVESWLEAAEKRGVEAVVRPLIAKYQDRADNPSARFCRAEVVVADLRAVLSEGGGER